MKLPNNKITYHLIQYRFRELHLSKIIFSIMHVYRSSSFQYSIVSKVIPHYF